MAGKGDKRRPTLISREEEDLNWMLAFGKITHEEWLKRRERLKLRRKR